MLEPAVVTGVAEGCEEDASCCFPGEGPDDMGCESYTERQNELYSEVWKLFSQSYTDVPAVLLCAMLPTHARGTCNGQFSKPTVQFIFYISIEIG